MSNDSGDGLLDKMELMESIVEEADLHEDDEDDEESGSFERRGSLGTDSSLPEAGDDDMFFRRGESVETEGSAIYNYDDEEEEDEEDEPPGPVEYQWSNPVVVGAESYEESSDTTSSSRVGRRASFTAPRRSSFASSNATSESSQNSLDDSGRTAERRNSPYREPARRRHSIKHMPAGIEDTLGDLPSSRRMKTKRQPFSRLQSSRRTTKANFGTRNDSVQQRSSGGLSVARRSHDSTYGGAPISLGELGSSDLDNVAAAAAVVAMGTGPSTNKRIQYAVNDVVLVYLNIMNHTNSVDPPEAFTICPVNKHGFPQGEGKSHGEQEGPFVYVMATVMRVHFNEDVPYYTVIREDTGTEQRADVEWMEKLTSLHGIEAARQAAHQTGLSTDDVEPSGREKRGIGTKVTSGILWPIKFIRTTLVPWYLSGRAATKEQVTHILFGDSPFACRVRITGINLLVLCSLVYMFLETLALAFVPAGWDYVIAVIEVVVWSILALELFLEWLIRPSNYYQLVRSDKAYAPSTARYINGFHLFFEAVALTLFIPQFKCLSTKQCGQRVFFGGIDAALRSVRGPYPYNAAYGRFCIGLTALRMFGLVRHWKTMWINRTYRDNTDGKPLLFKMVENLQGDHFGERLSTRRNKAQEEELDADMTEADEDEQRLKKAATIGTALMVVNSHRALLLLMSIIIIFPMLTTLMGVNNVGTNMVDLLQENNVLLAEANETSCAFLQSTVEQWLDLYGAKTRLPRGTTVLALWAQLLPVRCDWQQENGVITYCDNSRLIGNKACEVWENPPENPEDATPAYFADSLGIREGGIIEMVRNETARLFYSENGDASTGQVTAFTLTVLANHNHIVRVVHFAEFLLLFTIMTLCFIGLAVLRADTGRLVLGPLQRMLKIVVRYAKNPLSQSAQRKRRKQKRGSAGENGERNDGNAADKEKEELELGNYETEQLINAITKITDLLRKCWGVAGAGIISSNLARTEEGQTVMFNPTVPGKRVYALFGFVAIDGFSEQLRALDRDVMILINDVAKVVHDEVYRWALGDSGQCNKNLGSAFLMVFRIGDFHEVHERQARATDVVFSSDKRSTKLRRRRGGGTSGTKSRIRAQKKPRGRADSGIGDTLQLAALPGIQTFSDRALLGMLKSFAGLARDRQVQNWKKDFRLGAGVGAFDVNVIMGMDAGWAVEGAVGSEYKIDATYLSPHVNMASRMMSACKQYGVSILLSQAVEELLSRPARAKLRHLDTVYVKGSSVAQRVFTYDARHHGVDFFLFERSPEQSDADAAAYSPSIWDTDQDLRSMRQHVTDEFQKKFKEGVGRYLSGNWKAAISTLLEADDMMITNVLEEGYMHYDPDEDIDTRIFDRRNTDDEVTRLRHDLGDGACRCLVNYMERRKAVPPKDWNGVRPLTSK